MPIYIGIDLGTSGCRAIAIDDDAKTVASANRQYDSRGQAASPETWWNQCQAVLRDVCAQLPAEDVRALAIDGTSGTVLLADEQGEPVGPCLLYNDARATREAGQVATVAPADHVAAATTAGLPKALWLSSRADTAKVRHLLHQSDWLAGKLTGRWGLSDINNCLKSGFDPVARRWPDWMQQLPLDSNWLPKVLQPGEPIGPLHTDIAATLGLSSRVTVYTGTTDSTAAIVATGAREVGEAVTSLGSTLVMKVICDRPIHSGQYGIYSQPYGERWLAGGGSNSGGAVLRHFFDNHQLAAMTPKLQPDKPTGLGYYPLLQAGERFPVNDPRLPPRLEPRPDNDVQFFQALLEGMADIEHQAYQRLHELGAPYPHRVITVGGGSVNPAWTSIRASRLNVKVVVADHTEAAYGTALIAKRGFQRQQQGEQQ